MNVIIVLISMCRLVIDFEGKPVPYSVVVMIHWTRQIKEVLANQEAMETADSSGPLEEIEFWRSRCEDLSGLTTQLDKPGIVRVVKIIEKAKSSYLAPFRKLSQMILVCEMIIYSAIWYIFSLDQNFFISMH